MEDISIPANKDLRAKSTFQKLLLSCGILSAIWYAAINIVVPLQYPGYDTVGQTVSELSAIDAPTRSLWVMLCFPFSFLVIAFGLGIWLRAGHNKKLRFVSIVIIFDAVLGLFWPPMHKREIIAAGGGTLSDTLHLAWTLFHVFLMLLMIGFGAAALEKRFRIYSIATVIAFIIFGILTTVESRDIETGMQTPYIGIWERINIGVYMLWIVVFAASLLKKTSQNF